MGPRIACIVEPRYLRQHMPTAVLCLLREQARVDTVVVGDCWFEPETGRIEWADATVRLDDYELVIARNRRPLGLAMVAYAEAAGIPTVNSHAATRAVRDKAEMGIALARAGVPCAHTILADDVAGLARLPADAFPLILKATFGDNSQGLRLVRGPEELADVRWRDEVIVAQHYLPNDGFDLKLYVCDTDVFAVRKPSPFNGDPAAPVQRVDADAQSRALARQVGEVFGLEIYGVDAIVTPRGPVVIEVNEFPNFSGVPEAPGRVAAHLLSRVPTARKILHHAAHRPHPAGTAA